MATRRWGYFDGSFTWPMAIDPDLPMATETSEIEKWDYDDEVAWCALLQRLPDDTALRLNSFLTAASRWKDVEAEYTIKMVFTQSDLKASFLEMRCPKDGDVRAFLTSLHSKRGALAAVGVEISAHDYQKTVFVTADTFSPVTRIHVTKFPYLSAGALR